MTPQEQAAKALRSLRDTAAVEGRACSGYYYLGESPQDHGYNVRLTLKVSHDAMQKVYATELDITEDRIEHGQYGWRHDREMPHTLLWQQPASRMSRARLEQLYERALAELRADPSPLIKLLEAEENRT